MQTTLQNFPIADLQVALLTIIGMIIVVAGSLQLGGVVKDVLKRIFKR